MEQEATELYCVMAMALRVMAHVRRIRLWENKIFECGQDECKEKEHNGGMVDDF